MKIQIVTDSSLDEIEVTIKAPDINDQLLAVKASIEKAMSQSQKIIFYKGETEYFLSLDQIIFFETNDTKVYAHTLADFYEVKYKLYELEAFIPSYFCRVSKSSIINLNRLYSLEKSFSGSSTATFGNTNKKVHISRHYYKIVKDQLLTTRR